MNFEPISQAIIDGDDKAAVAEVTIALEQGALAGDILRQACIPAI